MRAQRLAQMEEPIIFQWRACLELWVVRIDGRHARYARWKSDWGTLLEARDWLRGMGQRRDRRRFYWKYRFVRRRLWLAPPWLVRRRRWRLWCAYVNACCGAYRHFLKLLRFLPLLPTTPHPSR